jgi:hypothetical protein
MRKNYFLVALLGISITGLAWQKSINNGQVQNLKQHKFSSGSPIGRTGAPGESNCTTCHNGTAVSGSSENVFNVLENGIPVSSYTPGGTYEVSLSMASNPVKRGFQLIALDENNTMAGTFVSLNNGTNVVNGGSGKKYVNHTGQGSNAASFPTWSFQWVAPSSDQGTVTFYVATNKTNANGQDTGDQIHLSQHQVFSTASVNEIDRKMKDFQVAYSTQNRMIYISYSSQVEGETFMNLVDLSGRPVAYTNLDGASQGENKHAFRVPDHIKPGAYIVHFFVNNNAISKSVMIGE